MDLDILAQKIRETLKTELDYYNWKSSGALRNIKTCAVIEKNPEFHEITFDQTDEVIRKVNEMVVKF